MQAIPPAMAGRDILGIAQTGTGKTAAFALPILDRLSRDPEAGKGRHPRALVLAPTRELAIQINDEFRAYAQKLRLRHSVIFGGVNQRPQIAALSRGVDIVVATPGRLLDLMAQGHLGLGNVRMLVLDEADRMLDMGFVRDVRKIIATLPRTRQSALFSATMPATIGKLAAEILHDPVRVEVAPQSTPVERISQSVHHVDAKGKTALLAGMLADPAFERVIVFSRTKHRASRVADDLTKRGIEAEAIHGNKSQNARQRALERFRKGEARVLVATDIAARGIEIGGITHVVNYELPNEPESYVHRIGRTARAGATGAAISFCDPSERAYLRDIERVIRHRLTVVGDAPAGPDVPAAAAAGEGPRKHRPRPRNRGPHKAPQAGARTGARAGALA
ncbi:MAG: DEAD/DEAH box helicase [Rubellimicrobium sp.]|nr:DEAD/DEAH box helicase [Rubellimicrobium sp.]